MVSLDENVRALLDGLGPFDELRVNNHWVPVTYLSAFTDRQTAAGGFYLYNRECLDEPPPSVRPAAVAKQRGLYLTDYTDGRARDTLERFFARYIERPYALIRNKLVYGLNVGILPHLETEEQVALALFIAMQQGRTPAKRREIEWIAAVKHTFDLRARLEDTDAACRWYRERTGEEVSPADIQKWRRELETGRLEVRPGGPDTWLTTFLSTAVEVAEIVDSLPWRLLRAPKDVYFPASDMPVVLSRRIPGSLDFRLGGGWKEPTCEATFALSADVVLAIGPSVHEDPLVGTAEWHRSVRERTILHSERFVFDRDRDPRISQLLRENDPPRPILEFDGEQFPVSNPVGPIVKKLFESNERLIRYGQPEPR